ncbi:MAG: serine hydrolase domain-containing protein [Actinomycetota bacterium]
MEDLPSALERVAAETSFSGVLRVERGDDVVVERAHGFANRALQIPNTTGTRFAIASGVKGMTALTVVSLIEDGTIGWSTTARSVLSQDLPLIDEAVTIEQLLAHRSGIGDYLDEDVDWLITDYVLEVPVHRLSTTEAYLQVLDGHPMKFAPGERFSYCNGGYVVLALIAERASGTPFHRLVHQRVCEPAGMRDTEFFRSDDLPGDIALSYLFAEGSRTNVLHLPVVGSGDGGISTTLADVHAFWRALFAGRIVSEASVAEMILPRSDAPEQQMRYGLGFWLHASGDAVMLEGYDAGVSFRTAHDRSDEVAYTVISNTSDGAWPLVKLLDERLLGNG